MAVKRQTMQMETWLLGIFGTLITGSVILLTNTVMTLTSKVAEQGATLKALETSMISIQTQMQSGAQSRYTSQDAAVDRSATTTLIARQSERMDMMAKQVQETMVDIAQLKESMRRTMEKLNPGVLIP